MTTVERLGIADGDAGTAQTCAKMALIIQQAVATPIVRRCVTDILNSANVPANDYYGQAYAVREWIANHIRFLRDPAGVELLHTPEWMLRTIYATGSASVDCDDAAILAGALMGAIGWSVDLVTVAFLDTNGFSHVYCSASAPSGAFVDSDGQQVWLEFDTTRPMQELPVEMISRAQRYPVL